MQKIILPENAHILTTNGYKKANQLQSTDCILTSFGNICRINIEKLNNDFFSKLSLDIHINHPVYIHHTTNALGRISKENITDLFLTHRLLKPLNFLRLYSLSLNNNHTDSNLSTHYKLLGYLHNSNSTVNEKKLTKKTQRTLSVKHDLQSLDEVYVFKHIRNIPTAIEKIFEKLDIMKICHRNTIYYYTINKYTIEFLNRFKGIQDLLKETNINYLNNYLTGYQSTVTPIENVASTRYRMTIDSYSDALALQTIIYSILNSTVRFIPRYKKELYHQLILTINVKHTKKAHNNNTDLSLSRLISVEDNELIQAYCLKIDIPNTDSVILEGLIVQQNK